MGVTVPFWEDSPLRDCLNIQTAMKFTLALFLVIALVVLLLPEDSEARSVRRRKQILRKRPAPSRRLLRQFLRKARTCGEACEPPPDPAADDAAAAEEGGEDGEGGEEGAEGEDIPDWCNPATEMGAWLNYASIRTICSERGATDFGPYGGIPAAEEEAPAEEEARRRRNMRLGRARRLQQQQQRRRPARPQQRRQPQRRLRQQQRRRRV